MFSVNNTTNLLGITINGDLRDLQTLYHSLSRYTDFYIFGIHYELRQDADKTSAPSDVQAREMDEYWFNSETAYFENMKNNLLGLCYDLRHAWQGDREYTFVQNNAGEIGAAAETLFDMSPDMRAKNEHARQTASVGNLYFSVSVLYPWALYYLCVLRGILDNHYKATWLREYNAAPAREANAFQGDSEPQIYSELDIDRDRAVIELFISQMLEALKDAVGEQDFQILLDYFDNRLSSALPEEAYIEGICTYYLALDQRKVRKVTARASSKKVCALRKPALIALAYNMMDVEDLYDQNAQPLTKASARFQHCHSQYMNSLAEICALGRKPFVTLDKFNQTALRVLLLKELNGSEGGNPFDVAAYMAPDSKDRAALLKMIFGQADWDHMEW